MVSETVAFWAHLWIWILITAMALVASVATILWNIISKRLHDDLVQFVHNDDYTVDIIRWKEIPSSGKLDVIRKVDGVEDKFSYNIVTSCIEQGRWGKRIEFDYHNAEPINPKARRTPLLDELRLLYKTVQAGLDTNLDIKLMRSDMFEQKVITFLIIIMISSFVAVILSGYGVVAVSNIKIDNIKCRLDIHDNSTWEALYIGTNSPPPSMIPQSGNNQPIPIKK